VNYFDVLVVANAVLAVIALYLVRPCTLILCGNNLLVARALGSIDRGGPPASQHFLPEYVFSPENLSTAAGILSISFVTMLGFTVLLSRRRVRIGPAAPAVPRFLLRMIAVYLVAYLGASTTILTGGYAGQATSRYELELAGAHTLICSIMLYEVVRRRLLAELTARRAFLIIFISIGLVHYLRGATGITTGYLVTGAVLLLPRTGAAKRIGNVARISAVMLVILACSFIVRGVRTTLHSEGSGAISSFIEGAFAMEQSRDETSEGIESIANANQQAAHMLMCITLFDASSSREWRSIYNVIEYTFIPSFFVKWFNWSRSIEAAWELALSFIHGGGINVLGEFYWNGGFLCVLIMATALSFFCALMDIRYRASAFWLMMMAQFAPSFLMGYGYGFAQVARGAINGLLVAATYWLLSRLRGAGHLIIPLSSGTTAAEPINSPKVPLLP
jgi:hypothetical protein